MFTAAEGIIGVDSQETAQFLLIGVLVVHLDLILITVEAKINTPEKGFISLLSKLIQDFKQFNRLLFRVERDFYLNVDSL